MGKEAAIMNELIPKSVLAGVIRDTIKTQSDEKIGELTDILHSGFSRWGHHDSRLNDHSSRLDQQHSDIQSAIAAMKSGFEAMDKRFDDLIRQMDKRFEAVDKRFSMLTWLIGIGFVIINFTMVALKLF